MGASFCSFNTATFEYPLSQLTITDTILSSDIFRHLKKCFKDDELQASLVGIEIYFSKCVEKCQCVTEDIVNSFPAEWNISAEIIRKKISELYSQEWQNAVWDNFVECLKENIENE